MTMASAVRLGSGDLARYLYRLGASGATGMLTLTSLARPGTRPEALVLRRGAMVCSPRDIGGRLAAARLSRLVVDDDLLAAFEADAAPFSLGTSLLLPLATWVKRHFEAQVDQRHAQQLLSELAGVRISVRPDCAPPLAELDEVEKRMLAALSQPRRLDQAWPLARAPRFRLLSFVHFLRAVGALTLVGVAAEVVHKGTARELLGVGPDADDLDIRRAFRQAARSLHPDLHGDLDPAERKSLEEQLATLTAAVAEL